MAACFVTVRASNCTSHGPAGAVALGVPDHRHGTNDQHLAQIPIACLGDAPRRTLLPEEFAKVTSRCLTLPIAWTNANGHQKVTTSPRETGSSCSSQKFTRPNGA